MTRTLRSLALSVAAMAAAVVLASCGTSADTAHNAPGMGGSASSAPAASGTAATGAKNDADIMFATMMIPHHAQAVAMAELAVTQGTDTKVKALAPKIKDAQAPEIARMTGWLTGWGEPVPGTAGGHDMSGAEADGMMSTQQMTDLGAAKGSAFDRMWLQMMVEHHEGAVAMARTELADGVNSEAKQLAQAVVDSQSAEISQMKSILAAIPG